MRKRLIFQVLHEGRYEYLVKFVLSCIILFPDLQTPEDTTKQEFYIEKIIADGFPDWEKEFWLNLIWTFKTGFEFSLKYNLTTLLSNEKFDIPGINTYFPLRKQVSI